MKTGSVPWLCQPTLIGGNLYLMNSLVRPLANMKLEKEEVVPKVVMAIVVSGMLLCLCLRLFGRT